MRRTLKITKKNKTMKKNSLLKELSLIAIILSVLIFAGCQKNPPKPTPVAPTLTVVYPQAQFPYGDSASFSWEAKGSVTEVTLNGERVGFSDSYQTGRLFDSVNTYKLVATGPGGTASKTFAINVGDWTTSIYGMISHSHWIFGYLAAKDSTTGYKWYIYPKAGTDPQFYTFAFFFEKNGNYVTKNRYTNKIISTHQWGLLPNDSIFTIDVREKNFITLIKKDSLFFYQKSMANNPNGTEYPVKIGLLYVRDSI